jgi:hypothetical protein
MIQSITQYCISTGYLNTSKLGSQNHLPRALAGLQAKLCNRNQRFGNAR